MHLRRLLCGSLLALASCAFPRGHTPVSPAPASMAHEAAPPDLFKLVFVQADVPPTMRSGLPWDEDKNKAEALADPYLEFAVDGRVLWRSPTLKNSTLSSFESTPSGNLRFDRNSVVELALWDDDTVGHDPIGLYRGRAFVNIQLGDDVRLELEGGTKIVLRLEKPVPMVGTGIDSYELHNDAIWVLSVVPDSPAARGGLTKGDRIHTLDGQNVRKLGLRRAEGKLAVAADQKVRLGVMRGGVHREVVLGAGPIWIAATR